jgi:DEAD/DEAH box helicase domain-containing protein
MSLAEHVLNSWADHPTRGRPFVSRVKREARAATSAPLPELAEPLRSALAARGITELYSHQAEALAHVHAGRDVVVATPTASGKSLVYTLATLEACHRDPGARALYLFPTKALAHDQVASVDALAREAGIDAGAHAYDGDTPADARRMIRSAARIVVSNPDMLHMGILPMHDRWASFFAGLRYVVLDEAHVYRGVFGSHVANVIRRLRRVCAFHGSDPQFVLSSATIANPAEHAEALIERPVTAITQTGAPEGRRTFYVYNPPVVDGTTGVRGSYVQAARRIARALAKSDVPTIVFCNSRLNVERLTRHLKEDVASDGGDPETVAGYRGGYLPQLRRAIEAGLRHGRVRLVVATNALELGVDIGQLTACVMAGYPGTIASTLQRAGRAGRREEAAAVVLVARSEPIDQYVASHPEWLHGRSPEHARLLADNLLVVADHIKCAAFELPFTRGEALGRFPAPAVDEVLSWLAERQLLHAGAQRWQWTGDPYPAHKVALRAIADGNFTVLDAGHKHTVIGEVDYHAAASTLHPQAIYIVGGQTWQVQTLDWPGRRAIVEPVHTDYYTDAMTFDGVRALSCFDQRPLPTGTVGHGEVQVFERVVGFKKIRFATGENVGYGEVDLPENDLHTTALWLQITPELCEITRQPQHRVVDALDGLLDALARVAAVHVMCDPRDLGTTRVSGEQLGDPDTLATLYLYERYPGGVGLHGAFYAELDHLFEGVDHLLNGCGCDDGCPTCVGAPAPIAAEDAQPRSRRLARTVLRALRGQTARPSLRVLPGGAAAPA